jgi:CheY-like chemotaxis protein
LKEERKYSVLIAEDDPGISGMMRLVLEDEGFAISVARDGLEAIEMVKSLSPDVLVLDLRMPMLTGDEVAARLQELPDHKRPKIVLSSASSALPKFAATVPVDGFLPKPFDIDDLVKAVNDVLFPDGPPSGS